MNLAGAFRLGKGMLYVYAQGMKVSHSIYSTCPRTKGSGYKQRKFRYTFHLFLYVYTQSELKLQESSFASFITLSAQVCLLDVIGAGERYKGASVHIVYIPGERSVIPSSRIHRSAYYVRDN